MVKQSKLRDRARASGLIHLAALFATVVIMTAPVAAQEGFSWRSYVEVGGGMSISEGAPRPLATIETGVFLGAVEVGSYIHMLPLAFGSPDLIQAMAVAYGGNVGLTLDTGDDTIRPFGRIGLGGVYTAEADETGGFSGINADKKFSCVLTLGLERPISERWSARLWGAYRLTDSAIDLEGEPLSGFDLGLSIRADWFTTIR